MITTPRTCAVCERVYVPVKENQRYCGWTCRKKNERQQAIARDPNRRAAQSEPQWTTALINPTNAQMDTAVEMLRYALKVRGGDFAPPVKITGHVPDTWTCPPDMVVERPPGAVAFRQLAIRQQTIEEMMAQFGRAAVAAPNVPGLEAGHAVETDLSNDPEYLALVAKGTPDPRAMRGAAVERPSMKPTQTKPTDLANL